MLKVKDFQNIIETYEIKGNHNTAFIAVSAVKSRIPKCVFGGDIAHLYDCMDELLHDELMAEIARQVLANKRKKLDEYDSTIGFEAGAKWADKTMIDKVCEWIADAYLYGVLDFKNCDAIINDFKKAMEEK